METTEKGDGFSECKDLLDLASTERLLGGELSGEREKSGGDGEADRAVPGRQTMPKPMELLFIRHGQGVHNTGIPDRLNVEHPPLTAKGREQVAAIRDAVSIGPKDVVIASPTVRTLQTARLLADGRADLRLLVSPRVGPRMYPMPDNPSASEFRCDRIYPQSAIVAEFPEFGCLKSDSAGLWDGRLNTMDREAFRTEALKLLRDAHAAIGEEGRGRAVIVSHDGTITSYREALGEERLTRADFLGEAGIHIMKWKE
ncbi:MULTISPECIES: phosphoglycerate mutase family protein [unclassified Paenibacillus]|uniref:histidine phosphatase family protein n=1 Tax=unclassified Paenibacillus TaxID=185978 RepID=UPI000954EFA4|nr:MULTISPECIES: phosphoglycerate mutase family protein [unclassified Paenibacillus]ASS65006.2 histidine phosphatase family protein [Paenibacillus sp. RUD330]SIQ51721.1 Broad specificity phosphatase PhoE [Paenibacillus sp. RU4X]SIQ74076.1 Broad specificity phosphatase PhoE [Paenibacillus sp. RU4T]